MSATHEPESTGNAAAFLRDQMIKEVPVGVGVTIDYQAKEFVALVRRRNLLGECKLLDNEEILRIGVLEVFGWRKPRRHKVFAHKVRRELRGRGWRP